MKADADSLKELQAYRQKTIDKAMGNAFSKTTYTKMMQILNDYRAKGNKSGN